MKYTKGKWKIAMGGMQIWADNKDTICYLTAVLSEHKANAKLIEAAPVMLEALQYVVDYHRQHDSGAGELFGLDYVTTCIAAIQNATL